MKILLGLRRWWRHEWRAAGEAVNDAAVAVADSRAGQDDRAALAAPAKLGDDHDRHQVPYSMISRRRSSMVAAISRASLQIRVTSFERSRGT